MEQSRAMEYESGNASPDVLKARNIYIYIYEYEYEYELGVMWNRDSGLIGAEITQKFKEGSRTPDLDFNPARFVILPQQQCSFKYLNYFCN
jgi:hypothetical protein